MGIVGAGNWGLQHARVFSSRDDVEVCAVVGRTPDKTALRAEQFGARPYTSIGMMLEKEKPDLVSVCLPNQLHFEPTMEVIESGTPLLVEKPLVFDLVEADALLHAARARDLFFAINFNHRYARAVTLARTAIEAGRIGDITFATWRFGGEGASDHPHANLIETQCHGFDMLEYLCGPIDSVMAEMTDMTGGGYRTLVVSLKFRHGGVGALVGTYDSSYAYKNSQAVEINGTNGRLTIEDSVRRYTFQESGSEIAETWEAGYFNDRDRSFRLTFDAYADDLLRSFNAGNPPPVHASAGRRALALASASIRSYEEGRRITIREGEA